MRKREGRESVAILLWMHEFDQVLDGLNARFFPVVGLAILPGFLEEMGVSSWYFACECVVVCVVKVGKRMSFFEIR